MDPSKKLRKSYHVFRSLLWCLWLFLISPLSKQVLASKVVTHLPGFHGPLPFYLETGYVEVDASDDAHMFYYYIKSERQPEKDPLILWIIGGPGCSGLSAILYQIGPLGFDMRFSEALPTLVYRTDTWTKASNIIFIDAPVNAGFSYSRLGDAYKSSDTKMASQIVVFLRNWFDDHLSFKTNPLYIGGDSYGGMIVPTVALEIAVRDESRDQPFFNLKGYIVGNPITDEKFDANAAVPFAHGMALISDELYELAKKSCGGVYKNNKNAECKKHVQAFHECTKDINVFHILEPKAPIALSKPGKFNSPYRRELPETDQTEDMSLQLSTIPPGSRYFGYILSPIWANNDAVKASLGVREGKISRWKRCRGYDPSWFHKVIASTVPYHLNLTTRGYRALICSGDHDMVVPYLGTQAWIRHLNSSIVSDWRAWFVDGQVAGYTRTYSNNLTFTTIKGAGHAASEYKPKECFAMFRRWIDHHAL